MLGPAAQIHLIEAGVPDELFEADHNEGDYLLYFGRLDWFQKGLDVLLHAMKVLAERRPGIKLKVAGRGKDLERFAFECKTLQLEDNIEIVGAVADAERNSLFAGAQLLLMPSRFEGFGMVAAEAMAAGLPIVAADAGSLPEVVDAPRGGVLVAAGNADALAEAVDSLLADPARRFALSGSARQSAERFRWNHIADQHMDFLEAIYRPAALGDMKGPR